MTGRYQEYPEYKDADVEWLGEIPTHWEVTKTAWHFVAEKGRNGQILTNEYIGQNKGKYPVYSGQTGNNGVMGCIDSYEFDTGLEGVLFSTTVGAKAMTLNHLKGKFSLSQNCLIIQKTSPIFNTRFCFYHFQPLFSFERGLIPEHMQASFRMEDLYQYKIALPSFEEQQKIANFLDHETAKIDTLIAKQEKLIELLKEKRQAVISHAVTRGLNPDAQMKDSGVEWLGEVPEHWLVGRLKNVLKIKNGKDYKHVEVEEGGYPVYGSGGVFKRSSSFLFDGTSVLFGRKGTIDKPLVVNGKFWTVDTMFYSEIFSNADADFIYYQATLFPFDLLSTNTALPSMTQEDLLQLGFIIPPLEEQKTIVACILEKSSKFSSLIVKCEDQIKLMKERKTALISAAVTGKIDVRDYEVVANG